MNKKSYFNRFKTSAAVSGLLAFMLFVFGPAETFFANSSELPFVYGEFSGWLWLFAVIFIIGASVVTALLPDKLHSLLIAILFGVCVCAYIQNMFLNKGLDLIGLNPDGYNVDKAKSGINIAVWVVIILIIVVIGMIKETGKKIITYGALFLLAVQVIAYLSLVISADKYCYHYPQTEYHLSGEEQYVLSTDSNIILFVVDSLSNRDLKNALNVKTDAIKDFKDFTYYTNMDCCYCGTYPSLTHMLTNCYVDMEVGVNDWTRSAWNDVNCDSFYKGMKTAGYKCLLYTPDLHIICGNNDPQELLDGKWSNFTDAPLEREVANSKVVKVMIKMAAYRMLPELMKNIVYVDMSEYSDAVRIIENPIMHENYDFGDKLLKEGISTYNGDKIFVVHHLMGTHLFKNDEFGKFKDGASYEETTLGCFYILGEYIQEMKKAGVYDQSTIIITADHGWEYGQQPVFFIKESGRSSDDMVMNNSPVTFHELLPTIARIADVNMDENGDTIYDFEPEELRERTLYIRNYLEEYPDVPYYGGGKVGTSNVYMGFTYTGDEGDLIEYLFDRPSKIIQMVDSYF